jgi:hypothetical protein
MNFVLNTLPKPVLIALLYRLSILQLASRILPTIGADSWASDEGVHNGWDDRPASGHLLFALSQKKTKFWLRRQISLAFSSLTGNSFL